MNEKRNDMIKDLLRLYGKHFDISDAGEEATEVCEKIADYILNNIKEAPEKPQDPSYALYSKIYNGESSKCVVTPRDTGNVKYLKECKDALQSAGMEFNKPMLLNDMCKIIKMHSGLGLKGMVLAWNLLSDEDKHSLTLQSR